MAVDSNVPSKDQKSENGMRVSKDVIYRQSNKYVPVRDYLLNSFRGSLEPFPVF